MLIPQSPIPTLSNIRQFLLLVRQIYSKNWHHFVKNPSSYHITACYQQFNDDKLYTLLINEYTPKSDWDFLCLNLARAIADVVVTTGSIQSAEEGLDVTLLGRPDVVKMLYSFRAIVLGLREADNNDDHDSTIENNNQNNQIVEKAINQVESTNQINHKLFDILIITRLLRPHIIDGIYNILLTQSYQSLPHNLTSPILNSHQQTSQTLKFEQQLTSLASLISSSTSNVSTTTPLTTTLQQKTNILNSLTSSSFCPSPLDLFNPITFANLLTHDKCDAFYAALASQPPKLSLQFCQQHIQRQQKTFVFIPSFVCQLIIAIIIPLLQCSGHIGIDFEYGGGDLVNNNNSNGVKVDTIIGTVTLPCNDGSIVDNDTCSINHSENYTSNNNNNCDTHDNNHNHNTNTNNDTNTNPNNAVNNTSKDNTNITRWKPTITLTDVEQDTIQQWARFFTVSSVHTYSPRFNMIPIHNTPRIIKRIGHNSQNVNFGPKKSTQKSENLVQKTTHNQNHDKKIQDDGDENIENFTQKNDTVIPHVFNNSDKNINITTKALLPPTQDSHYHVTTNAIRYLLNDNFGCEMACKNNADDNTTNKTTIDTNNINNIDTNTRNTNTHLNNIHALPTLKHKLTRYKAVSIEAGPLTTRQLYFSSQSHENTQLSLKNTTISSSISSLSTVIGDTPSILHDSTVITSKQTSIVKLSTEQQPLQDIQQKYINTNKPQLCNDTNKNTTKLQQILPHNNYDKNNTHNLPNYLLLSVYCDELSKDMSQSNARIAPISLVPYPNEYKIIIMNDNDQNNDNDNTIDGLNTNTIVTNTNNDVNATNTFTKSPLNSISVRTLDDCIVSLTNDLLDDCYTLQSCPFRPYPILPRLGGTNKNNNNDLNLNLNNDSKNNNYDNTTPNNSTLPFNLEKLSNMIGNDGITEWNNYHDGTIDLIKDCSMYGIFHLNNPYLSIYKSTMNDIIIPYLDDIDDVNGNNTNNSNDNNNINGHDDTTKHFNDINNKNYHDDTSKQSYLRQLLHFVTIKQSKIEYTPGNIDIISNGTGNCDESDHKNTTPNHQVDWNQVKYSDIVPKYGWTMFFLKKK